MRILVTGGPTGFVGKHLSQRLYKLGHLVHNAYFDITDPKEIQRVLESNAFDYIFHFAAISHNVVCDRNPSEAYRVNVLGTQLLIDNVNQFSPQAKIIFPSTSYVYDFGKVEPGKKITEECSLAPKTIYAKSKLICEDLFSIAHHRWGTQSIILRLFNHTHKSQDASFFLPSVYQQILDTKTDSIKLGSLNVRRDIGLIHDLIETLVSLLDLDDAQFSNKTFNVCSEVDYLLSDLVQELLKAMRSPKSIYIDQDRVRKNDPVYICGDMKKLSQLIKYQRPHRSIPDFISKFIGD